MAFAQWGALKLNNVIRLLEFNAVIVLVLHKIELSDVIPAMTSEGQFIQAKWSLLSREMFASLSSLLNSAKSSFL